MFDRNPNVRPTVASQQPKSGAERLTEVEASVAEARDAMEHAALTVMEMKNTVSALTDIVRELMVIIPKNSASDRASRVKQLVKTLDEAND